MADDDRPDARDPEVATWLAVDPLDEVTRRRLVSNTLRETDAPRRPSRALRWIAAAAAVVVLGAGTLALVTARGGNDQQDQAATPVLTPDREAAGLAPKSAADAGVGDFGNLDEAANLSALRDALVDRTSFAAGSSSAESTAGDGALRTTPPCAGDLPAGTVVAQGSGTLDGRPVTVVLTELADGSRSFDAVFTDPCEVRHLP